MGVLGIYCECIIDDFYIQVLHYNRGPSSNRVQRGSDSPYVDKNLMHMRFKEEGTTQKGTTKMRRVSQAFRKIRASVEPNAGTNSSVNVEDWAGQKHPRIHLQRLSEASIGELTQNTVTKGKDYNYMCKRYYTCKYW